MWKKVPGFTPFKGILRVNSGIRRNFIRKKVKLVDYFCKLVGPKLEYVE